MDNLKEKLPDFLSRSSLSKVKFLPSKVIVLIYNSSEAIRYFALFVLFVVFAALPPYLLFNYHGKKNQETNKQKNYKKIASVGISESSQALQVQNSEILQANEQQDFLLFAWFKLSALPKPGQRMVLFRKYSTRSQFAPGYAVSIIRAPDGLRAAIYWNDQNSSGRWYNLAHFNIPPQQWFLLALSRLTSNSVGAHVVYRSHENEVVLERLGGFKHALGNLAKSPGDLEFGAQRKGFFSGKIGPFAVLSGKKLRRNIDEILVDIFQDPNIDPATFDGLKPLLWSPNAKKDLGPSKFVIKLSKFTSRRNKKNAKS